MENHRLNIAFVLPGTGSSGGVRCTVIAANHLLSRGHRVRILYRRASSQLLPTLRQCYQAVIHPQQANWLQDFTGPTTSFAELTPELFAPGELVVGVGMWAAGAIAKVDPQHNPRLQYLHGLTPWMSELMQQALPLAIPKIAVSSTVAAGAQAYGGGAVLAVIGNGIDCSEYYACQPEVERNGIGTIFAAHPAKDPATILATLQQLKLSLPFIPQYVFGSGRRPPQLTRRQYWRLPTIKQARNLYSRAMIWILGSRSEGFPAPPLEAMACGCAVITTDCGGVSDYMINGKNGFVVPVGDVEAIVANVKLLVRDSDLRRQIVDEGRKTVNNLNWKATIDKLEAVLNEVVAQHCHGMAAARLNQQTVAGNGDPASNDLKGW